MGTIEKRTTQDGKQSFRAKIRLRGHPVETATFRRKTDASKWVQSTESAIREGRYFEKSESKRHVVADLIDRYVGTIAPKRPKSMLKKVQQLSWWKKRLGAYKLSDISPAIIAQCRDELEERESNRIDKRSMQLQKYC